MDITVFREAVFKYRGQMNASKVNADLVKIVNTPLADQAMNYKRIGLKRLAELATTYDTFELIELNNWLNEHKTAKKAEIELFITSLGDDNETI